MCLQHNKSLAEQPQRPNQHAVVHVLKKLVDHWFSASDNATLKIRAHKDFWTKAGLQGQLVSASEHNVKED